MTGSIRNSHDVSIYASSMAERLERESCDCKTCVWSMGPGCWSVESYLLTPPLNQVKNASSSFLFFFLHVSFFERSLNTGNTDVNCSGKGSVMKFTPSLITNRFLKVAILHVSRDVQGRKKILKRVVVAVYCLKALSTWLKLFVAALLLSQLWTYVLIYMLLHFFGFY